MRVVSLSSVCEVTAGQAAPQESGVFGAVGKPFIRAGSLERLIDGSREDECELISDETAKELRLRLFPRDTILFAKSGMSATLGRIYRLKSPAYVVSHLAALVPGSAIEPAYLQRWFERNPPSRLIPNEAYPSIRTSEIGALKLELPELKEQQRIAAILDKADAIRRKHQQAMQLADEFLRSVFLDMFGDVYSNPKKWPQMALGDWADILTGYAFPSEHFVDEGNDAVRLCRGANVLPGQLEWSDTEWWPISDMEALSRFQLSEGDVILALDRPWISAGLKVAQVSNDDLPSLLVQRVARIRGRTRAESLFFFFAIDSAAFTRHCKPTETTIPHISPIELRAYMVPRPPDALLDDFYQAANISLRQNNLMGRALDEAEHLFSSCCQRAFRGEL